MSAHIWAPSTTSIAGGAAANSAEPMAPPLSIMAHLPLAFALNGILSGVNEVRKCAAPSAALACLLETERFLLRVAKDVDTIVKSRSVHDEGERTAIEQYAHVFRFDVVPHACKALLHLYPTQATAVFALSERVGLAAGHETHRTSSSAQDKDTESNGLHPRPSVV